MNQYLPIVQLGDPVLRQAALPVYNFYHPKIQALIDQLLHTVQAKDGVGLAAPQLGVSKRILVVASRPNTRYPHAPLMEPTVMINPRIVSHSETIDKDWEGCLSVPGVRGLVPRYTDVEVEYSDRTSRLQRQRLTGFVARIFQHEFDHLEGKIFLDQVDSTQDLISEQHYQTRVVSVDSASNASISTHQLASVA